MKILYVITLPDIGGAQTHLLEIACAMKNDGNDVQVIAGKYGWLTEQLELKGIKVGVIKELVREISLKKDWAAVQHVRKIIKNWQPDIVHCHSSKAGIVGRIAAWLECVPGVFTAHGWAFTEGVPITRRVLYSIIENIMLNITAKCFCVSEYDRCLAKKWFLRDSHRLITVHNGVVEALPQGEAVARKRDTGGILRLIMVGRFSKQKDHMLFIKAVHDINQKYPGQVHLSLVGDGDLFAAAKQYVVVNNLGEFIILLGESTCVDSLLAQSDVFCLISNYEGLPISIIEAMRAGLPVIASDVGGNNELVEDGINGYLISRGDREGLVQAIEKMLKDRDLIIEFGKRSQEKFRTEFAFSAMMQKIESAYRDVLKKCY